MTVSLYVRVAVKGKRRYTPVNKKRFIPMEPSSSVFATRAHGRPDN
jgi:hypothetical protein